MHHVCFLQKGRKMKGEKKGFLATVTLVSCQKDHIIGGFMENGCSVRTGIIWDAKG